MKEKAMEPKLERIIFGDEKINSEIKEGKLMRFL